MSKPTLRMAAHPAPGRNLTIIGAPELCVSRLQDVNPDDLAQLLRHALTILREQSGRMPDFNAIFLGGGLVGHVHMLLIPRDHTKPKPNIDAGFEGASCESIITADPRMVAALLRKLHSVGEHRPGTVARPETEEGECLFCDRRTPSTLFSVRDDGTISVPEESGSFSAAADFLRGRDQDEIGTYYQLVGSLARHNEGAGSDTVRVFANLTPALVSDGPTNCVVVGLADRGYHSFEFADLPVEVISAYIRAFQFLEASAEHRGLVLVPFFNCGVAAGGTVNCPHGQAYILDEQPMLYRQIAARRESRGRCGVCEILSRPELAII